MLHIACDHGLTKVVELIMNHESFNPDLLGMKNRSGGQPVMSISVLNSKILELILNHEKFSCRLFEIIDKAGNTVLQRAIKYKYFKTEYLLTTDLQGTILHEQQH